MKGFVDDQLTVLTPAEVFAPLHWALETKLGVSAWDDATALLMAQWALETDRGKACHLFNFGNVKATPAWDGDYTSFACGEELTSGPLGAGSYWINPDGSMRNRTNGRVCAASYPEPPAVGPDGYVGHPWTRFRAYANEYDGALGYVTLCAQHFPAAWQALLTGSATAFVHALKQEHYFTADEATYARGVASLQREMLAVIRGLPPHPDTTVPEHVFGSLAAATIGHRFPLPSPGEGLKDSERGTLPDTGEKPREA